MVAKKTSNAERIKGERMENDADHMEVFIVNMYVCIVYMYVYSSYEGMYI